MSKGNALKSRNKKVSVIAFIFLLLFIGYFYTIQDFPKSKNSIYLNGEIITINEKMPTAQAMWVENGLIKSIGTNDEILKLKPESTEIVDLKGAVILPGFIDPHTHPSLSAFFADMIDLSGFTHNSNQEVWDHLREAVKAAKPGEWIVCKGIDPVLVKDLKTPSIDFLNEISPNNPLILFAQSLHSYWGNTIAFQEVGINKNTPNPSKSSYYEKDEKGALTGLVVEQEAFRPFITKLQEEVLTKDVLTKAINQTLKEYAQNGNTTIVSTGLTVNDKNSLILFEHLSSENSSFLYKLLEKIGILPTRTPHPRHFIYLRHDTPSLIPEDNESEDDFYDIIGIKHWMDGSPYIGSMYLKEAYLSSDLTQNELHIPEGHAGKALISKEELVSFIKEFHQKGWQIAFHTQGDAAIEEVLEAFEIVDQEIDLNSQRHRIEHCLLLPEAGLDQMKKLNITPSFHINHLYYYGDALKNSMLGPDRVEKILPIKATQEKEIIFSLHADQPMFESKPFRLIQTAIERQTQSGYTISIDQQIGLMDGLKALTIDAAWQIHKEDKIGSLEVGKYADFIVLDQNPFKVDIGKLEEIKVLRTFINGNEVK